MFANTNIKIISILIVISNLLFPQSCENLETGWSPNIDGWSMGTQDFVFLPNEFIFINSSDEPVGSGGNCITGDFGSGSCFSNPFSCDVLGIFTDGDELVSWEYYGLSPNTIIWSPFEIPQNSYMKFYDSSSGTYYYLLDSNGNLTKYREHFQTQ